MKGSKRNISVQLIRIVAMFLIILDHLLMGVDIPLKSLISQVTNSGVLIFLFLSGFLYGKKITSNWSQWYVKRIARICVPMWIFMIVDFIVEYALWGNFELKYIFIYMFNLQGILGVNIGGESLWFLTLIMLCYLITPLLQWIRNKNLGKVYGIIILMCFIGTQVFLAYFTDKGMVGGHTFSWCIIAIAMYIVGYFVGDKILFSKISWRRITLISAWVIFDVILVIFFKFMFDGQIIYDKIVIYYGMVLIDFWMCIVLYKLGEYIKGTFIKKIITFLDTISYEIYIVHCLVIFSVTLPWLLEYGVVIYVVSTLLLSLIAAVILHWMCKFIYSLHK